MLAPNVPGSRMVRCADCEQWIWLSPSSWRAMLPTLHVCMGCAAKRLRAADERGEPQTFAGTLPGQLDELMAAGLPEMTAHHLDQIDAAMLEKLAEKDNAD